MPVIGIIGDYGENILIDSFVKDINNVSGNRSLASNYFTILKFAAIYISLFLVIILMLYLIIRQIKNHRGRAVR